MRIINYTPYRIVLLALPRAIPLPPQPEQPRLKMVFSDGQPIHCDGGFLETLTLAYQVEGLPEPQEGVAYVVTSEVAIVAQAAGRPTHDLFIVSPQQRQKVRNHVLEFTVLTRLGPAVIRPDQPKEGR